MSMEQQVPSMSPSSASSQTGNEHKPPNNSSLSSENSSSSSSKSMTDEEKARLKAQQRRKRLMARRGDRMGQIMGSLQHGNNNKDKQSDSSKTTTKTDSSNQQLNSNFNSNSSEKPKEKCKEHGGSGNILNTNNNTSKPVTTTSDNPLGMSSMITPDSSDILKKAPQKPNPGIQLTQLFKVIATILGAILSVYLQYGCDQITSSYGLLREHSNLKHINNLESRQHGKVTQCDTPLPFLILSSLMALFGSIDLFINPLKSSFLKSLFSSLFQIMQFGCMFMVVYMTTAASESLIKSLSE